VIFEEYWTENKNKFITDVEKCMLQKASYGKWCYNDDEEASIR
jgi:hypothetical protein